jgi:hypothetical protein
MSQNINHIVFLDLGYIQNMTYFEIFTIGNADCLVMKKISNRPITQADIDYRIFLD